MFMFDNITLGIQKPHLLVRSWFVRLFKLDNITSWLGDISSLSMFYLSKWSSLKTLHEGLKNYFFDHISIGGCSSLTTLPKELVNLTSLMKLDLEGSSIDNVTRGTLEPHFLDMAWFVGMFKLDNNTWGIWKSHSLSFIWEIP